MSNQNGSVLVALALVSSLVLAEPANAVKRRAFATSVTGTGNLNSWPDADGLFGLAAADRICRNRAAAGGLSNANAYRAWLSTAATDAYCHVQGRAGKRATGCSGTPQPAGPWFILSGTSNFTGSLDELTGPERKIVRGVLQDEFGDFYGNTDNHRYWTGTSPTGEVTPATCSSWVVAAADVQGATGEALASSVYWTQRYNTACNGPSRLLCLEPGLSEPMSVNRWLPGAVAFVTSASGNGNLSTWPESAGETGIDAGDAICRTLAENAGLPAPESFVAWLSDANDDARDRLTLTNVPYRRVDGYRVADTKADLLDLSTDNSMHVDETGAYPSDRLSAFTGTDPDGTYEGSSCNNWTATSQPGNVTAGSIVHMNTILWTAGIGNACVALQRLYCFSNVETLFWDGFELTGDTSRWSLVLP